MKTKFQKSTVTPLTPTGKSRQERKAARTLYAAQHPVLSGVVPIVQYVPPAYNGRPAMHV